MFYLFYTHNQYNYPNNYQIIDHSFKGFLLAEQWKLFLFFLNFLSLIGSFYLSFLFWFYYYYSYYYDCCRYFFISIINTAIIITIIFIITVVFIITIVLLLLSLSFILSSVFFVKVCIVLYPLIFPFLKFCMPQVKDQQSHTLYLILTYFNFVTTVFS